MIDPALSLAPSQSPQAICLVKADLRANRLGRTPAIGGSSRSVWKSFSYVDHQDAGFTNCRIDASYRWPPPRSGLRSHALPTPCSLAVLSMPGRSLGTFPNHFPFSWCADFIIAQPVPTAMTKPLPLALSRQQLALVQRGAKGVPPEWHARFEDAVFDELLLLDNITDADVNHAVTVVLLRIMMAV
jgi:hypothetical protein